MLVDRYCASIADDGVAVDRMLAFTFTERAAAEMRTRIRRELVAALARRAARATPRARDELLALARATERAWVMTIHAFCRRLLATHPLAAGLDPAFRVLDASRGRRACAEPRRRATARRAARGGRRGRGRAPPRPTSRGG